MDGRSEEIAETLLRSLLRERHAERKAAVREGLCDSMPLILLRIWRTLDRSDVAVRQEFELFPAYSYTAGCAGKYRSMPRV